MQIRYLIIPEKQPIFDVVQISVSNAYCSISDALALVGCCSNCASHDTTVARNCCASSLLLITVFNYNKDKVLRTLGTLSH